jgi:hypothetical protein
MTHKNIWTINVALFGSLIFGTSFAALTDYDGKWNGLISCTANARDVNDVSFSRNNIYSINEGRISASYSTRGGAFQLIAEGTVNNASASMMIKRSDVNNQWATNLKSVSIGAEKIVFTGEAVQRGVKLRDCTMELTVVEPAVNSLASKNRNAQLAQTAKVEAEAAAKAAAQKEAAAKLAAAKLAAQKEAAAKEAAAKAAAQKEAADREAAAKAAAQKEAAAKEAAAKATAQKEAADREAAAKAAAQKEAAAKEAAAKAAAQKEAADREAATKAAAQKEAAAKEASAKAAADKERFLKEAEEKAVAERNAASQSKNLPAPTSRPADPAKKPETRKVDSILDL